jgi:superoxide dismutase, Fe-Mn family
MELHHSKHHATYAKGANTALEQLTDARDCEALRRWTWRGFADLMFGLSSLSGILLDELAEATGRSRGDLLHAVHLRYLDITG